MASDGLRAGLDDSPQLEPAQWQARRHQEMFVRLNAVSLLFTVGVIALLIVALACIIAIPLVLNYLPPMIGLLSASYLGRTPDAGVTGVPGG